jgi:hypothetical protein
MVRGVSHFSPVAATPTSDLFCRFVYQVVVSKTLAPKELVNVFESDDRVVLPLWDPMVSRRAYLLDQLSLMTRRVHSPEVDSFSLSGLEHWHRSRVACLSAFFVATSAVSPVPLMSVNMTE